MSQIDIVARLQLRADQFVSEAGRAAAEVSGKMNKAAADVRQPFVSAFAEVQKLAGTALTMPRTKGGSLNLSAEIASLREAEAESSRYAQAMRELSIAQTAAAASGKSDAASLHLEADASAVAALSHEREAAGIRDRIEALKIVQSELNKTTSQTTASASATRAMTKENGAAKAGWQQVGFQVQDAAVQIQGGTSIMTVAVQQGGQLFGALGLIAQGGSKASEGIEAAGEASGEAGVDIEGLGEKVTGAAEKAEGLSGKFGKVAGILAGPWGAAITVGLAVLSPLVAKVFESNDALGDNVDKLTKDAEAINVARQAKDRFAKSEAGVAAAIRDSAQATKDAIEATKSSAEQDNIAAKRALDREVAIRRTTLALLDRAKAEAGQANSTNFGAAGGAGAAAAQTIYRNRVSALEEKAQEAAALITQAEARVQETRGALAAEAALRAVDPMARIKKLYDDQVNAARAKARAEGSVTTELTKQLTKIEAGRQAALKAEQDRQSAENRKPRETSIGQQVRSEQASSILAAAQRYTGAREDTASGRATLKDLFSTAGISIDPDKVAWCAAFVNAVLSGQGIKGTGSLSARSFLGYGTATDRPTQGDIVVLKRGDNASQGHVGFYAGERGGRVMVTGGNQGDAVGTQSFARSDVLGFRRAPTASADFKSNAREAAQEVKELDSALDGVKKRFDPATAAAADFAELLGKVTELKAAGRLTAQEADDLTFKALIEEGARRRDAQLKAWKDALGDVPDMAAGVGQYDQEQAAKWDRASVDLQESQQRRAEANLRDLSDLYYDLFDGSSANIWANFQRRAFGALADVAAKETVKLFSLGGQSQTGGGDGDQGGGDGEQTAVEQLKRINAGITKLPFGISKETAKTVLQGAGIGAVGGSVFASITGGKNNAVASSVGGVLGDVAGKAIGKSVAAGASGLLKSLGGAAGPLGAIAGGVLGGLVGGLFQKTKQASSTLTFGAGGLGAAGAVGTGTAEKAAASASANSVVGSLNRIAEALGGDVTGAGSVSIGYRPGHKAGAYRVDTSGQGRLTGVLAFATEEEAIRAAIADALKDGVIGGISDAAKRILAAGGDLEKAITKASLIESVPKSLKAMLDPVGAAVDDLNRSFQKTVDALKEGGATAEQMAQAQQLYDLQLAQVKNSTESASASLKSFRDSLVVGSSSPLSLRDQEAAAVTKLQPFLDQIAAGKAIDQAKYQEAARSYLDVERQLYGSTQAFFEAFDKVQASTAKAIATIDNAVPVTAGVASPFAKETAASAAATAAGVQTGNQMTENTNDLLAQLVAQNAQLIAAMNGGASGSSFIGSNRSFVAAR